MKVQRHARAHAFLYFSFHFRKCKQVHFLLLGKDLD